MARGAQEFGSMDEFLKHKTKGGGGKFLSGWKKKPGYFNAWMHVARLPMALWRHPFPIYKITKNKTSGEEEKHVYSQEFTCHENEDVLTHPWRDKVTKELEYPPQRCGMHKFADYLWMEIIAWLDTHTWDDSAKAWAEKKKGKGKGIDPCAKLFNFVSEVSDEESTLIHVGGYCGYLGQKPENLPSDVKKAMARAKIAGSEVWKENCNAKCKYILCVVDDDDPGKGVQIATETQALGDRIKEVIQKVFKSEDINIQKHPYLIKWEYDDAKEFSKKYDATQIMKVKPSPRVLKLIRGDAPDLTELKTPFKQQGMRAIFEEHCLLKNVPWDDIFPTEEQEEEWAKEDAAEEVEEPEAPSDEEEEVADDDEEDDEEEDEDDDEMVACDECKKPMKVTAKKCPHCDHEYEVEEEEEEEKPEPEPTKVLKTRAERAKEAEQAKAKVEKSSKKPVKEEKPKAKKKEEPAEESEDADDDDDDGDQLPF